MIEVDVSIIGSGPAGLACAIGCASEGLSTLIIEGGTVGGQAAASNAIENYLGFGGLQGQTLAKQALAQATQFGATLHRARVEMLVDCPPSSARRFCLVCSDGELVMSSSVVLALGVAWRPLEVPGFSQLTGHGIFPGHAIAGVSYICTGRNVLLIGAGNSAGQAALHLARCEASRIYIATRSPIESKMSAYLVERIRKEPLIEVVQIGRVISCNGGAELESVTFAHDGGQFDIQCTLLFAFIGAVPATHWVPRQIECTPDGFIVASATTFETTIPGIFAIGDCRAGSQKRVAVASGEGAGCVSVVYQKVRG